MRKRGFLYRWMDLYVDGFRHMTIGKTLWLVILIKLFIIFVVLKGLFFPDYLRQRTEKGEESDYVSQDLVNRLPR